MDEIKKFFEGWDWKRVGKIALVIIPVLVWEIWYFSIRNLHNGSAWINDKGDKILQDFLGS